MRHTPALAFLLPLCFLSTATGASGLPQTLPALREMVSGPWEKYAAAMRRLEGTMQTKTVRMPHLEPDPERRVREERFQIVGSYPRVLVERSGQVQAVNDDYHFRILRDEGGDWRLVELEPVRAPAARNELFLLDANDPERGRHPPSSHPGRLIDVHVLAGLLVVDRWLPNLLADPHFRLLEIRPEQVDGKQGLHISFSAANPEFPVSIDEVSLFLLPDQYWVIKQGEAAFSVAEQASRMSWVNEYVTQDGVPVPVAREQTAYEVTDAETKERNYVETRTFALQRTVDTSPERFRLSAYGLPEPDFGTGGRSATRLVLAALTLLILMISSLYAVRRGTSSRNPHPEAEGD